MVKIFNRTVREQDAVIDADAIRRGEGGGETLKGKNPIRNGTLWRSREKERRRWLELPRSEPLGQEVAQEHTQMRQKWPKSPIVKTIASELGLEVFLDFFSWMSLF